MLKIFFGNDPGTNYIFNPDIYFNNTYEDSWITSEIARKMIKDIDGSEVKGPCMIDSPFLGPIPPEIRNTFLMLRLVEIIARNGFCSWPRRKILLFVWDISWILEKSPLISILSIMEK